MNVAELGKRVRRERVKRALSLSDLEERSGVSRSMISAIERGTKASTIVLLDRIATALSTTLATLLTPQVHGRVVVLRHAEQTVAKDPSGWQRRILSPVLPGVEFELMRTTLDGGVDAGVFAAHGRGSREYVAVEKGKLRLTLDGERYDLATGDSIYYDGDCEHGFANLGRSECVYYLAMDVGGDGHRRPKRRPRR